MFLFSALFSCQRKERFFNKNTPIPVTNQEKNHLIKIFDNYYEKLKY